MLKKYFLKGEHFKLQVCSHFWFEFKGVAEFKPLKLFCKRLAFKIINLITVLFDVKEVKESKLTKIFYKRLPFKIRNFKRKFSSAKQFHKKMCCEEFLIKVSEHMTFALKEAAEYTEWYTKYG